MQEGAEGPGGDSYPCYEFNVKLKEYLDDGSCEHCRMWLTVECENIDEFVVEEDWEDEF